MASISMNPMNGDEHTYPPYQAPATPQHRQLPQPERRRPSMKVIDSGEEQRSKSRLSVSSSSHLHHSNPLSASRAPPVSPNGAVTLNNLVSINHARETGALATRRGVAIAGITMTAQLMDLLLLSSATIALPSMQRDLHIDIATLPWIVSAYTLTFGGYLLIAGVISDRYGRRPVFCIGMIWLSIWSLAVSFARNPIALIIFRAFQGLGAAATIPSAIGVICTFFHGSDQNYAMAIFGSGGAVGWTAGLILGGMLSGTIGWRWIFRIVAPMTAALSMLAWFLFPVDKSQDSDEEKPSLDFFGALIGSSSMILLVFALSSSEGSGWRRAIVIAPLIVAFAALTLFLLIENKAKYPVMPLALWRQPGFAATWFCGLFYNAWWGSCIYYVVLIAQGILGMSPFDTAIRLVPFGVCGLFVTLSVGVLLQKFGLRTVVISGLTVSLMADIPGALLKPHGSFWSSLFITSMVASVGCSIVNNTLAIALVASVPVGAKSLAGGLINTAFQIGTAIGLAICGVVQHSITERDSTGEGEGDVDAELAGMIGGLWTGMGLVALALAIAIIGVKKNVSATNAHAGD